MQNHDRHVIFVFRSGFVLLFGHCLSASASFWWERARTGHTHNDLITNYLLIFQMASDKNPTVRYGVKRKLCVTYENCDIYCMNKKFPDLGPNQIIMNV